VPVRLGGGEGCADGEAAIDDLASQCDNPERTYGLTDGFGYVTGWSCRPALPWSWTEKERAEAVQASAPITDPALRDHWAGTARVLLVWGW
jgi:hypothetical protein